MEVVEFTGSFMILYSVPSVEIHGSAMLCQLLFSTDKPATEPGVQLSANPRTSAKHGLVVVWPNPELLARSSRNQNRKPGRLVPSIPLSF